MRYTVAVPDDRPSSVEVDPRVTFAAERTVLAWLRTGLALMGFGFVVARFSLLVAELGPATQGAAEANPTAGLVGAALVATGLLINVTASVRHVGTMRRLARGETIYPSARTPVAFGAITAAGGVALLIVVVRALWS